MRRFILVTSVLSLVAIGVYAVGGLAGKRAGGGQDGYARGSASCEAEPEVTARAVAGGKVLGNFDTSVTGVCQMACATRGAYDAGRVVAQPGASAGRLTQCPVSGVVFTVDARRPQVAVRADRYVTCCDGCAEKLRKDPTRFVKV